MDDLRLVLRRILREGREIPMLVATLGVGVGIACAAWTLLETVILRPLPYPNSESLVRISSVEGNTDSQMLSDREFHRLRAESTTFTGIAVYASVSQGRFRKMAASDTVFLSGAMVSGDLFAILGSTAERGRTLQPADETASGIPPAVISERLVNAGLVEGTIGELLRIEGITYSIVGIMPEDFHFPDRETEYWIPIAYPGLLLGDEHATGTASTTVRYYRALGRLAPGVGAAVADEETSAILKGRRARVAVRSLHDAMTASARTPLFTLQATSLLLLLVACGNAAWLFACRTRRFSRSLGIMLALGATPRRLIRTLLLEALTIGLVALPTALLLAWSILQYIPSHMKVAVPRSTTASFTVSSLLLTGSVAALVSIIAALPAVSRIGRTVARQQPLSVERSGNKPPRLKTHVAMIIQGSIVFALCLQAFLLLNIVYQLLDSHTGFANANVVTAEIVCPPEHVLDPSVQVVRYADLLDTLDGAGVKAAVTSVLPLSGNGQWINAIPGERETMVGIRLVSASYFSLLGIAPRAGRLFSPGDAGGQVVVVNDVLANRFLGGVKEATGQTIAGGKTVIGVVSATRHLNLFDNPEPAIFILYSSAVDIRFAAAPVVYLLMDRHAEQDSTIRGAAVEMVGEVLPEAEVRDVRHFESVILEAAGDRPTVAFGVSLQALVALFLLLVGFYGMLSELVMARRREIAIRLALGARPKQALWTILAGTLGVTLQRLVLGLGLVWEYEKS